MGNLNHERPQFRVMDAGGGERVRTIKEELDLARAGAAVEQNGRRVVPRCELCGSTKVSSRRLRCAQCVSDTEKVREARLHPAAGAGPRGDSRSTGRRRTGTCPECHTELPVSGDCGFCW